MQHPLIVSYYTPGTAYETHAMALRGDVDRLGLSARIEPREARGSWLENCAQKAGFIREMHQQEQRPLLWLDADARLHRPLRELQGISADFAAVRRRGWEFSGGQIYFGAGPAATRLLDIWCDFCQRFPQIWDQVSLGYAWWEVSVQEGLNTHWLDESLYTRVAKRPAARLLQRAFLRAPILHQQESRRSKAKQGVPSRPEFGMDNVPQWWRAAAKQQAPFPLDEAQRRAIGLA
jgi:hypothetical protein